MKSNKNPNSFPVKIEEIIQSISQPHFDIDFYCGLILGDDVIRDKIIMQMIHHPDIMVYYHCFYIIDKASQQNPALFYRYWSEFAALLKHTNSYHRDFGLILIANLTRVDEENRIIGILYEYLQHSCDPKFMTARCCVQNCRKIIQTRPELIEPIITSLLVSENCSSYTVGQKALLKFDLLEIIQQVYLTTKMDDLFGKYILDSMNCESPKTRKKAKELAVKFSLNYL